MANTIRVEFDRDGELLNAIEENENGEFIRSFSTEEELDEATAMMTEIDNGRWDGEASTELCPAYEGRACTTGGTFAVYQG